MRDDETVLGCGKVASGHVGLSLRSRASLGLSAASLSRRAGPDRQPRYAIWVMFAGPTPPGCGHGRINIEPVRLGRARNGRIRAPDRHGDLPPDRYRGIDEALGGRAPTRPRLPSHATTSSSTRPSRSTAGCGPVEQGEGDSVVGAFSTASDAVAAALDVQRAFAAGAWPDDGEVRVRMAVHTGEIRLRDAGNYFGPTIIRCARMRAIGHGGQTLISDATRDLVVDALPDDAELRDLGLHRLKDLGRAERIWQLVHPELPHEFPPLRSLGSDADEPARAGLELRRPGGRDRLGAPGRARASLGHPHRYRRVWQDPARVARRGRSSSTLIPTACGAWSSPRSGTAATSRRPWPACSVCARSSVVRSSTRLTEQLHDLDALLVVDNCEQVLDAAARMIESLLAARARKLRVLATSREPLGVAGEVAWRVPSLDRVDRRSPCSWSERNRHGRGSCPTPKPATAIAQIAERLDGIPLAIELAAARVRMMHPTRIAAGARRPLPAAHRRQPHGDAAPADTRSLGRVELRAARRRRARRSRVGSRCSTDSRLDAAEAVGCDDETDRFGVLDMLTRLVDKSMIQVDHDGATPATGCSSRSASSFRRDWSTPAKPTQFAHDTSPSSSTSPSSWRRASRSATDRRTSHGSRPITTTSTPRWNGVAAPMPRTRCCDSPLR